MSERIDIVCETAERLDVFVAESAVITRSRAG